ncbi:hypothetical protein Dimus_015164 [Dionaea muscipula]
MAESMALLPEDVLVEILYRLPVKTLIRFTCVCKQWLSLIRSPQFATKQLLTAESNLFRDNFQFFFITKAVDCDVPDVTTFLLWNPSIREVELLPFPLPQHDHPLYVRAFGFGYDPKTNDYKVFVIFSSYRVFHGLDCPVVGVYNLCEGYWKFLPIVDESIRGWDKQRLILNGKMCNWLSDGLLISFDLADEIFIKTPFHECWEQQAYFGCTLLQTNKVEAKPRVMWEIMCLHPTGDMYSTTIEIWELDEYGPSGCWSKQNVIEFPLYKCPLGYWLDGEALILPPCVEPDANYKGPLLAYNSITKELKSTGFEHASEFFKGVGYIESLVSVKKLCRHHNHRPQYDSHLTNIAVSVREVNAHSPSTYSINSFPSYCIERYED